MYKLRYEVNNPQNRSWNFIIIVFKELIKHQLKFLYKLSFSKLDVL